MKWQKRHNFTNYKKQQIQGEILFLFHRWQIFNFVENEAREHRLYKIRSYFSIHSLEKFSGAWSTPEWKQNLREANKSFDFSTHKQHSVDANK